jgi:hypothetical protein
MHMHALRLQISDAWLNRWYEYIKAKPLTEIGRIRFHVDSLWAHSTESLLQIPYLYNRSILIQNA